MTLLYIPTTVPNIIVGPHGESTGADLRMAIDMPPILQAEVITKRQFLRAEIAVIRREIRTPFCGRRFSKNFL